MKAIFTYNGLIQNQHHTPWTTSDQIFESKLSRNLARRGVSRWGTHLACCHPPPPPPPSTDCTGHAMVAFRRFRSCMYARTYCVRDLYLSPTQIASRRLLLTMIAGSRISRECHFAEKMNATDKQAQGAPTPTA